MEDIALLKAVCTLDFDLDVSLEAKEAAAPEA